MVNNNSLAEVLLRCRVSRKRSLHHRFSYVLAIHQLSLKHFFQGRCSITLVKAKNVQDLLRSQR